MFRHRNAWVNGGVNRGVNRGLAWLLLIGLLGSVALAAQRGVIKFKDGRPAIEGEIEEKADTVSVSRQAGDRKIQIDIPRDAIASIEYVGDLDAEYNAKLAKIDPKDPKARIELARWAFDRRKWDWARAQAEGALALDPNSKEATDLLDTIRLQVRLEQIKPPTTGKPATSTTMDVRTVGTVEKRYLSPEQINRIRQKEIVQSKEKKDMNVEISMDLERRFTNAVNIEPSVFHSWKKLDQIREIVRHDDQKLIDEIKVREDPQSMAIFRRDVQTTVTQGCATPHCHAGPEGAGLILYPETDDKATYTNFYILQKYTRKIEPVQPTIGKGPVAWKMIDRTQPSQSLLLQYGLPTDIAEADHPQVPGWKPLYGNVRDDRYRKVIKWIEDSLNPVEPEYGIDFKVPKAATTRPAGGK